MSTTSNPLSQIRFPVPFGRIQAGDVEPAVDLSLAGAQAKLDALIAGPHPRTFGNTMRELDRFTERLEFAVGVARHLEGVATYPELRAAYNAAEPKVSAFLAGLPLNEGLWNAVREFAATEEARRLEGALRRYLTKTMDEFRRHGAELDASGKARLKEIDIELAGLTTKFGQNVLDDTNAFELVLTGESSLAGLPPPPSRLPGTARRPRVSRAGDSLCRLPATSR